MTDFGIVSVVVVWTALSVGLVVLCDRLMGKLR